MALRIEVCVNQSERQKHAQLLAELLQLAERYGCLVWEHQLRSGERGDDADGWVVTSCRRLSKFGELKAAKAATNARASHRASVSR